MSDTVLKKEFKEKDVQRLRNLVTKNHGDKTSISVGYTKQQQSHTEGSTWEEDGRTWTIKNGIKVNVTKLDAAKKAVGTPLFCPNCKKVMNHKFDKQFYHNHHKCYSCVIEQETLLRAKGEWDDYEKNIHNSDIDGVLVDFTSFMESMLTDSNQGFITEQGDVESWNSTKQSKEVLLQQFEQTKQYLENLKK